MAATFRRRAWSFVALLAAAAWATTYGPFPISSIGSSYASTTYAADAEAEYEGANKVAQIYLAPVLNTPQKIEKAIKEDNIRVVYFDGQIAEFKIARWPSTIPLDFKTKLSSANQQTKPYYIALSPKSCFGDKGGSGGSGSSATVNTGYWGSYQWWDNESQTGGTTATWISTGTYTYTISSGGAYPKQCP